MKEIKEFLQNLEMSKLLTKFGEKAAKVILVVVVILVLLVLAQIGMFFGIFNWLENIARTVTGLDAMLAKAIAFLLMALLFGTPLSGFVWSFLPIPQKHKKRKRFIFLAVLGVMFFGAYFASQNVYFNPNTGEPVKYYSIGPDGKYKFSSSKGYDPVTGEKLKPVTKEVTAKNYSGESTDGLTKKDDSRFLAEGKIDSPQMYEKKYTVEFSNKQKRGIFFCFTRGHDGLKGTDVIFVPAGETVGVSLTEGRHLLAFLDTEFNGLGHRSGGEILTECLELADSIDPLGVFVTVGKKCQYVAHEFSLKVLAEKDQKISLEEDESLLCNMEKAKQKEIPTEFVIAFFLLLFIVLILSASSGPSSGPRRICQAGDLRKD